MPRPVLTEAHGPTLLLRMSHGKVNALDLELLVAVREAFEAAPEAVIVLTGNQRAFSAGLDLRALLDAPLEYSGALLQELSSTCVAIFNHPRPVIAAVDGAAIAGGAMLALATDVRIMSHGVIGLPELRVGVPIPGTLMELARHVLGNQLSAHLLRGQAVEPGDALAIGMIDEVVEPEQLLERAMAVADELGSVPTQTFALTKRAAHALADERISEIPAASEQATAQAWQSDAVRTAIAAQVERMARR